MRPGLESHAEGPDAGLEIIQSAWWSGALEGPAQDLPFDSPPPLIHLP